MNLLERLLMAGALAASVGLGGCGDDGVEPGPDTADVTEEVHDVGVDADADPQDTTEPDTSADIDADPDAVEDLRVEPLEDGVALTGSCTSPRERHVLGLFPLPLGHVFPCAVSCADRRDRMGCATSCIASSTGVGSACASCAAAHGLCVIDACATECSIASGGRESGPCRRCSEGSCDADFIACAGALERPAAPDPVTCASPGPRAILESGQAGEYLAGRCWSPCVALPSPGACVDECMSVPVGDICAACFEAFASCALRCAECGEGPWSWECQRCGGAECLDGLRACTGSAFPIAIEAAPTGSVLFANAAPSVVSGTLVASPDGAPIVRRVGYGVVGLVDDVPTGTRAYGLTRGQVGSMSSVIASLTAPVVAGDVTVVVAQTQAGRERLWLAPTSAPREGWLSVVWANGLAGGGGVRVRHASAVPSAIRVEPGATAEMELPASATGDWELDLDDNGTFEVRLGRVDPDASPAQSWLLVSEADSGPVRAVVVGDRALIGTGLPTRSGE